MPGPARKPEQLRRLEGYPDNKPPRKIFKARQVRPALPGGLSAEAKKEWKRIVDACMKYGLCGDIDHAIFRAYIFEWEMCEKCQTMCMELGITVEDKQGGIKRAPWDTSLVQHRARLQSIMNELGFTPAARSKVSTDEPANKPRDPFAVFDGGRLG